MMRSNQKRIPLSHVNLSSDVYFVCVNHALSTEREEIVGLLVGEIDEKRVVHVLAIVLLRRSDKRKDRVEISPEQLSNASTEAERLSSMLKRHIHIIGWYHSHPKLTVWPSPIDVNTQDSYQLMDTGFVGMIFSVFNEDPTKKGGRIQMTCFQSHTIKENGNIVERKRVDVAVHIVPSNHISNVCMKALIQLPRFLCQEEQVAYQMSNQVQLDYLTRIHNVSVYLRSMAQIAEIICGPLTKMLEDRIINNEIKRKKLQNKKKEMNMVLQQIQTENARASASEAATLDNVDKTESSVSPNAQNVLGAHTVIDPVALDDILLGNVSKSTVGDFCAGKSDVTLPGPSFECTPEELSLSSSLDPSNFCGEPGPSSVSRNINFCCQPGVPSSSKDSCMHSSHDGFIQNTSKGCSSKKNNLDLYSPPDSP